VKAVNDEVRCRCYRTTSTDSQLLEHLTAKEGECKTQKGPEGRCGGYCARSIFEGIYEVKLDGEARSQKSVEIFINRIMMLGAYKLVIMACVV
jgi:hypothetical protein